MGADELIRDDDFPILLDWRAILRFEDVVLRVFLSETAFDGFLGEENLTVFE